MNNDQEAAAELLTALAVGLRRRVGELRRAEEHLARFAFHEGQSAAETPGETPAWHYFVLRALAVGSEPENFATLAHLVHTGDASLTELQGTLEGDRLGAVDRVSLLTQTGYVTRDLESDRVIATPLAHGFVRLVDALTTRAAAAND